MRKMIVALLLGALGVAGTRGSLYAADINLAAAASMKEVLNELTGQFAAKHGGVTFRKNYGGSGALAKQIENGAPADIFVSANDEWMAYLKGKRLVAASSVGILAYNQLVFVGRPGVKAGGMGDLALLTKVAIGSPGSVPAGAYAMAAMKGAGIDRQLEKKLVMARDVRECLLYADRGEVDGAFVYRTDALQAARSARILFVVPQHLYPRVTYPLALTVTGAQKPEAAAFLAYVQSPAAVNVLAKYGFLVK